MRDPNLDKLIAAADALRTLLPELVLVGGCVTGLMITDEAAGEPRGTVDVDAIAEIKSYAEYVELGNRLRSLGFNEDTSEGAPVCRWIQGGTILDVMPLDENILGFSNRWYRAAMKAPVTKKLRRDVEIRMVTAPYFVATKLEAFKGRGGRDFLGSHDLEDIMSIVDGREALSAEVRDAGADLSKYVRGEIAGLLANPAFIDVLPGFLLPDAASQSLSVLLALLLSMVASLKKNALLLVVAVFSVAANVILNLFFMRTLGVAGIALSTAVVHLFSVVFLANRLFTNPETVTKAAQMS